MADTTADQAGDAGVYAGEVAVRLDRLPFTRTLWRFVTLISLGGIFELYDLFMTAYISPGLIRSGLFPASGPSFFSPHGVGFVYSWSRVSSAVAGLLIGFFLKQGGTMGVALFIGAAMLVMCSTIGLFGERTRNRSLEEISR